MDYISARTTEIYQGLKNIYKVLGIGRDEGQGGTQYHEGIWCDWTFTDIPQPTEEIKQWVEDNDYMGNLHLINESNQTIIVKTIEQLEKE